METAAAVEEFITIVPVEDNKPITEDSTFVTVLTVSADTATAKIVVCRPRGARLGLGLKFEGGSAATEKVRRLLVQSCAEGSPASNASTPWGKLIPGDEILAIDGVSVSDLTRIECVRRLKESDENLILFVRHFEVNNKSEQNMESNETLDLKSNIELVRPSTLPPPVPPRKLGKKNSFKDINLQTVGEQNALANIDLKKEQDTGKEITKAQHIVTSLSKLSRKSSFDSHIHRQNKESFAYLKKGSPEEVRRLVRRLSDGRAMPPDADIYVDLFSNDIERCLILADAESDDTGSSISTVVDRLGSMAGSLENSIPSTPIMQPKLIDIQKVLNSIENIDTDILKDMTSATFLETRGDNTSYKNNISGEPKNQDHIKNSVVSESMNEGTTKSSEKNDNNNNVTQSSRQISVDDECLKNSEKVIKFEVIEKPKPMPRNTKVERSASEKKRRPIPTPELLSPTLHEPLLTATKKTCIETWLMKSEAEMSSKEEKNEENSPPEALPRLIDFVPKMQFKENVIEPIRYSRSNSTSHSPGEPREDGSGASLDTIGELDESSDVTDNAKPSEDEQIKRKSQYQENFWNDRVNKSDAEDKSLSNDETPMPSCPRQPPDGVETPSDSIEKAPDLPTRLPPRLPSGWPITRSRFSYSSRTQDARSEASVKDKIAMFSVDVGTSVDRLDKCGTLPIRSHSTLKKNVATYKYNYADTSTLGRRLTKSQDNLDETSRSSKRNLDRPEVLGALEIKRGETQRKTCTESEINSKPLFYGSTTALSSDISLARSPYQIRCVSEDSTKNVSTHKSNLEYLIEQRKKSMSKLRGLVIPEVQAPIVDLPEIKVQDTVLKKFANNSLNKETRKDNKINLSNSFTFAENTWKTNFLQNNIPKYSPAFKRKSLQVYTPLLSKETAPERKALDKMNTVIRNNNRNNSLVNPSKLGAIDNPTVQSSTLLYQSVNYLSNNAHDLKNVEIKICTATDIVDSDNDSTMSSTQSSYRSSASSPMHIIDNYIESDSHLSPRTAKYNSSSLIKTPSKSALSEKTNELYMKRNVCRSVSSDTNISLTSSAGSAATSGSQASCSSLESSVADSDKRKISKVYNIDTINRRNIVASAKCRSGRDVKLESPVGETKFSHESYNRSPSPIRKTSERLSTLTPAVSATVGKGENRRRNKIVVVTDSDSDAEVNIRQRKSDFKNTRLKRTSSTSNKSTYVENDEDVDKSKDIKTISKKEPISSLSLLGNDSNKSVTLKNSNDLNVNKICNVINTDKEKEKCNEVIFMDKAKDQITAAKDSLSAAINSNRENEKINSHICLNSNLEPKQVKLSTHVYRLKKGVGSGVGLILAGGIDCEAKDVTVHRVLEDSIAAKAGIKRGSKVHSINGYTMSGLTHAQSVSVLKEQRSEVKIEIMDEKKDNNKFKSDCGSEQAESKKLKTNLGINSNSDGNVSRRIVTVLLEKAGTGAGLGFGLDGGRDSPQGDRPLTVKKLFAGGAAAQSGRIVVGAELLSAGGQPMENFTRTQAWAALKALPAGQVALILKNP